MGAPVKPLVLASLLLASSLAAGVVGASVRQVGNDLIVSGDTYAATFSGANGSLSSLRGPEQAASILASGEQGLWFVRYRDGSEASAAAFALGSAERGFSYQLDARVNAVHLMYRSAEIEVAVTVTGRADGVDLEGEVTPKTKTVLTFALPARLRFDPDQLDRFICPMNGNSSVGSAFKRGFFKLQPQDKPTGWRSEAAGTKGYVALYGGPLDQRADADPPTALSVTPAGREWFTADLAARVQGAQAVVNRPPTRAQADLILADSANGPYLSASHLNGQGFLWRLGGGVGDSEKQLAADLVTAVVRKLAALPHAGRTKIGLVSLKHGPLAGGWTAVTVPEWRERLETAARGAKLDFVDLTTAGEMIDAAKGADFLAILNPYGEWAPVSEPGGMDATVAAVGAYVRGGGNWVEVGGYPFFYAMRALRYLSYGSPYPDAFADFLHLDTKAGSASIYRVEPLAKNGTEPSSADVGGKGLRPYFSPGNLACGGDEQGGYCDRSFGAYVAAGETWRAPLVRVTVGHAAPEDLRAYCEANEIKRRLEDKISPEVLAKLKRSVLVYYGGNCQDKIAHLGELPVPTLIHFADYLKGNFDKQYPDHLPPNPGFGTPEQFRAFFDRAHELGHLVMPYTNPTWWCDHPKGPTFEQAGDAPLLKNLDGNPSYERYSANDGWTICFWHPAVQAANRKTVREFTDEYPVDVLFQDQCGARGWLYDTNPASPTPYAYSAGLISMVAEDSQTKPLSTESGWDRVVNYESQLCGMTWAIVPTEGGPGWRTLMKYDTPPETWEVYPLAEYIAHDKTMMLHHDLGQFVTNREVLAWTLGLGFSLSYTTSAAALSQDAPREWLRWLDRLQKSVCARYIGEPLTAFEHDRGPKPTVDDDGVIRATYGPVKLVANLGPNPRTEGGRELPGYGFTATAPGLIAANVRAPGGAASGDAGASFVVEGDAKKADVWVYGPSGQEVAVELPQGMAGEVSVAFDAAKATVAARDGRATFRLPDRPGQVRVEPPAALAGKAPRDWPGAKPAIGVIDLGPGVGLAWTRITPDDWVKAFTDSHLATVKRITQADELVAALKAGPTAWLAIVNPYGETFPETAPGKWREMLDLIRGYVNNGGSWWETAGYSFYRAAAPGANGQFVIDQLGPSGMDALGLPIGGGEVEQPPEPLRVTEQGREWLGADLSERIGKASSVVNRGLLNNLESPPHLTLIAGEQQGFVGAFRLEGWGYLWRIGGFQPNPEVALPAAVAAMEFIYTHPPQPAPAGGVRYLWHAVVTK